MRLIVEWRMVVKRFWSFRLALASAVLSACEITVLLWQPLWIPQGLFALLACLVSLAAGVARIVAQPKAYAHD